MDTITRTRDDIVRDLLALSAESGRLPRHYVDRKAVIHKRINQLLTELEAASVEA